MLNSSIELYTSQQYASLQRDVPGHAQIDLDSVLRKHNTRLTNNFGAWLEIAMPQYGFVTDIDTTSDVAECGANQPYLVTYELDRYTNLPTKMNVLSCSELDIFAFFTELGRLEQKEFASEENVVSSVLGMYRQEDGTYVLNPGNTISWDMDEKGYINVLFAEKDASSMAVLKTTTTNIELALASAQMSATVQVASTATLEYISTPVATYMPSATPVPTITPLYAQTIDGLQENPDTESENTNVLEVVAWGLGIAFTTVLTILGINILNAFKDRQTDLVDIGNGSESGVVADIFTVPSDPEYAAAEFTEEKRLKQVLLFAKTLSLLEQVIQLYFNQFSAKKPQIIIDMVKARRRHDEDISSSHPEKIVEETEQRQPIYYEEPDRTLSGWADKYYREKERQRRGEPSDPVLRGTLIDPKPHPKGKWKMFSGWH